MQLIESRWRRICRQVQNEVREQRKPSQLLNVETQKKREPLLGSPKWRYQDELPRGVSDFRDRPRKQRRRRKCVSEREVPNLSQSVECFRSPSIPPREKPIHLF